MADEAFALSPISARAALPSEADYDAIREAFMETSRGRWFLGEYAKRNRNADTSMVLDAVARIEETLAQRPQPATDDGLEEALAAIRGAVDQAGASISATLDGLGLAEKLAPIRKGARIVKEISWRWREIGADGRICDLLDSQVGAIEAGCEQISAADPRAALGAAFERIRAQIDEFGDTDVPAQAAGAFAPAAAPTPEMPAAMHEAAADADDEAVLDLVAMEMAALDDAKVPYQTGRGGRPPIRASADLGGTFARARDSTGKGRASGRRATAAGDPLAASARRRTAPRGSPRRFAGALARFDHHRERDFAKAQRSGQRSAGADPAHEPDREDRVLLLATERLFDRDRRHVRPIEPGLACPQQISAIEICLRRTPCPVAKCPVSNHCCCAPACWVAC